MSGIAPALIQVDQGVFSIHLTSMKIAMMTMVVVMT
jgi:hypothetical protein